jgi:hypothetical protein
VSERIFSRVVHVIHLNYILKRKITVKVIKKSLLTYITGLIFWDEVILRYKYPSKRTHMDKIIYNYEENQFFIILYSAARGKVLAACELFSKKLSYRPFAGNPE